MSDLARCQILVQGVVQGVGYRYFVRREAIRAGIGGWVANRADGGVDVVAEGARDTLDAFLDRLSVGPPGAVVRDLEVAWLPPTGEFSDFTVRAGGHSGD